MGLLSKITKPFRKVLKSPIGKAALMLGIGHFGPTMFGQSAGMGNWGKAYGAFKKWPMWKQAATVGGITMGAGAVGDEVIDETSMYVNSYRDNDYMYMKTSQYFISKQDKSKVRTSDLADYCDMVRDGVEPEDTHFKEKVV